MNWMRGHHSFFKAGRCLPQPDTDRIIMKPMSILIVLCSVFLPSCGKSPVLGAYPLKTCVISGEPLGGMGDPYVFNHEGTEVRLCCKHCLEDFNADPGKYTKVIKDAAAKK